MRNPVCKVRDQYTQMLPTFSKSEVAGRFPAALARTGPCPRRAIVMWQDSHSLAGAFENCLVSFGHGYTLPSLLIEKNG